MNSLYVKNIYNSVGSTLFIATMLLLKSTSVSAMPIRGTIAKDNHTMAVGFNLNFGDDSLYYRVSGSSVGVPRFWSVGRVDANYSGISVTKVGYGNGQQLHQHYSNYGMLYFHPRQRDVPQMQLAGIAIRGNFVSNALDSGLDFSRLEVGNRMSRGFLNYNSFNGYHSPMNGFSFGDTPLRGHGDNGSYAFNYDGYAGQNILETNFSLGGLKVSGTVQFSDRTSEHTSCSEDSEGNESCTTTTTVDATRGSVAWNVTHLDGTELHIATPFEDETTDDRNLRSLIAFIELISADITQMR